ncbi:hypothetical protein AQJ23_16190 [Streptomyces antibioticus]|nr:hypothetical protein [Streptomyces antibioticus]KUN25928.1 hypothetical protein AQJ23_16190 [Streptomyces antibioticus]
MLAAKYSVVYIPNPMIGVRGIHEVIVNTFGQTPSHLGSRLTVQTGKVPLAEREERGRTPVLVVDEGPRRPMAHGHEWDLQRLVIGFRSTDRGIGRRQIPSDDRIQGRP